MSDWRIDLQELHRIGGEARVIDWHSMGHARAELLRLGLIEIADDRPAKSHHRVYRITARGRDVAEGRLARIHRGSKGPAVWRLSWLSALPRPGEIRLERRPA